MKLYTVILFFIAAFISFNQSSAQKITISGFVKDAATKEALIGATVLNANTKTGTTCNQYGFFSLTTAVADTIELLVSFTGYSIQAKKIISKKICSLKFYWSLQPLHLLMLLLLPEKITAMCRKQRWVLLMCR